MSQDKRLDQARAELFASLDLAEQALDAGEGETYSTETVHTLNAAVRAHGASLLAKRDPWAVFTSE